MYRSKNQALTTILSLSGPVPIQVTGTPVKDSILSIYYLASLGNEL